MRPRAAHASASRHTPFHGYIDYTAEDCYALPEVLESADFAAEVDRVFAPSGPTGEQIDLLQEWVDRGRKLEGATSTHVKTKVAEAIQKHLCRSAVWTKAIGDCQVTKDGHPWKHSSAYDCLQAMSIAQVATWAMRRAIPYNVTPLRKRGDEIDEITDVEVRTHADEMFPDDESKATTDNWVCIINKGAQEGDDSNYCYWDPEEVHKLGGRWCTKYPPVFTVGFDKALSAYYLENPNVDMLPGHAEALTVFRDGQKMTSPALPVLPEAAVEVQGAEGEQSATEEDRSKRPLSSVGARARSQTKTSS